jgi:hypothetical protein
MCQRRGSDRLPEMQGRAVGSTVRWGVGGGKWAWRRTRLREGGREMLWERL